MILNDKQIKLLAERGMISPFVPSLIRSVGEDCLSERRIISYGLSSFGYDIRLSSLDFKVFRRQPGQIVDPKRFSSTSLESCSLVFDGEKDESYFILPAHSYGLGVAVEHLSLPRNITAVCIGKSSYARVGLIANITPAESEWRGHLTLEFSNASSADVKIYANEGVVQLLFLKGDDCEISYQDRDGKYQDQGERVTLPRV